MSILSNRLFRIFLILWLIRLIISSALFIVESGSLFQSPLSSFLFAQMWQTGELALIFLAFHLLGKFENTRIMVFSLLYVLVAGFIIWAIADPIVVALAGDHLTPSLLAHFAGPQIFLSDELWLPIVANYEIAVAGLLGIIAFVYLIYVLVRAAYRNPVALTEKQKIYLPAFSVALLLIPFLVESRFLAFPPEAIFTRNALGWDKFQAKKDDIENLRQFLDPQNSYQWQSDDFPVVCSNVFQASDSLPRPNIILLVIESFRARETRLYNPRFGTMELPGLESFASRGIIFPSLISNGFPSTEGFTSLTMGIWPHAKDRIVINHKDKTFFSLAQRLESYGYSTFRIEDYPDYEEEGHWIKDTYHKHVTFADKGLFPSEGNMFTAMENIIDSLGTSSPGNPYFIHLKTRNPHYPYEISDEEKQTFYTIGEPRENYPVSMQKIDLQVREFYEFLLQRDLLKNTVVIITGDHANYLDKMHATSLPTDETVWSGAVIAGNEALIGRPDTVTAHASHVDITSTVLRLANDNEPKMALGRNLLDRTLDAHAVAVAIRPAGVRLDYNGYTYIVDRRHPSQYISYPAFGGIMRYTENEQPPFAPEHLLNLVDTWTYLIEENRVYHPRLSF